MSAFVQLFDSFFPGRCLSCSVRSDAAIFCGSCANSLLPSESGQSGFLYTGAINTAIQRAKFSPCEATARRLLSLVSSESVPSVCVDAVTYVPVHPRRHVYRGFDFSALLARRVARVLSVPFRRTLECRRFMKPLSTMSMDREVAVRGKFSCRDTEPGRVLLVDDVRTTGATLREATWTLRDAGYQVSTWTLCSTPREDSNHHHGLLDDGYGEQMS